MKLQVLQNLPIAEYQLYLPDKEILKDKVKEIGQFITHLAKDKMVSASTQNQALCAIVFLFKNLEPTMIYTHVIN